MKKYNYFNIIVIVALVAALAVLIFCLWQITFNERAALDFLRTNVPSFYYRFCL